MFQGSYRYRPVTELSLAQKPLRHLMSGPLALDPITLRKCQVHLSNNAKPANPITVQYVFVLRLSRAIPVTLLSHLPITDTSPVCIKDSITARWPSPIQWGARAAFAQHT
jgi:hypothetical protein